MESKQRKTWKCTYCQKNFKWRHELARHVVIHDPSANVKCEVCTYKLHTYKLPLNILKNYKDDHILKFIHRFVGTCWKIESCSLSTCDACMVTDIRSHAHRRTQDWVMGGARYYKMKKCQYFRWSNVSPYASKY